MLECQFRLVRVVICKHRVRRETNTEETHRQRGIMCIPCHSRRENRFKWFKNKSAQCFMLLETVKPLKTSLPRGPPPPARRARSLNKHISSCLLLIQEADWFFAHYTRYSCVGCSSPYKVLHAWATHAHALKSILERVQTLYCKHSFLQVQRNRFEHVDLVEQDRNAEQQLAFAVQSPNVRTEFACRRLKHNLYLIYSIFIIFV